jgi:glycosyltransferase involved in cell wall biosynthesis
LNDIPLDEHQRLLESAAVYVISVVEDYISVGQIRAMNAIRAGIPIVATRVIGLEDYLVDNESALLVPPGDHIAMRSAVECLLSDEVTRQKLAIRAFEVARERTFERYLADLKSMVQRELEDE